MILLKKLLPLSMLSKADLLQEERKALDLMYDALRTAGPHSETYWNRKHTVGKVQAAIRK